MEWEDLRVRPPFKLKWVFWGEDSGTKNGLLAVDGVILFSNVGRFGGGCLFGVDAQTGEEIWRQRLGGPYVCTMDSTDGLVFHPEKSAGLLAFEVKTGRQVWRRADLAGDTNPLAVNGIVFSSSRAGKLHAVRAKTGETIWQWDGGKIGNAAYGDGLVVVRCGGDVAALDAKTGAERWRAKAGGRLHGLYPLMVADGLVFAPEFGALKLADGTVAWAGRQRFRGLGAGRLFGNTFALNAKTGEQLWSVSRKSILSEGDICGAPIHHNGVIYYGTGFGSSAPYVESFFALDAGSGKVLWRYKSGGVVCTSPIIYDGKLYFASSDRGLYCFEPSGQN
jgi:outer membrane protein assembly factor BamB